MDQLLLSLVLIVAIALGFWALYMLLRRASAEHAARSSEQAIAAAVSAALSERRATADSLSHERAATVETAVARAAALADQKLDARMREGTEQLDARMRAGSEQLDARFKQGSEKLEANMKLGHQKYDSSTSLIEKQNLEVRRELKRMEKMVTDLQEKTAGQHGALEQQLTDAAKATLQLQQTTGSLRDALGSSQKRGHWGERMAQDVLNYAGFKKGINYRVQSGIESGGRPDFTIVMPQDMFLHMDVKFPADNFLLYLEADSQSEQEQHRKQFLKDARNRVKELAARRYHEENDSVDTVVLFIPNENIFTFIQENAPELMDEAMASKIVLCGPSTLIAVLQVVRQAIDSFMLEQRSNDIMACLADFKKEWDKFSDQIDKHGKQLNTAMNSFNELAGARTNQLGRHVRKIDAIQATPISATAPAKAGAAVETSEAVETLGAVELVETGAVVEAAELEVAEPVDHDEVAGDSSDALDDADDARDADASGSGELWPPLREVSNA